MILLVIIKVIYKLAWVKHVVLYTNIDQYITRTIVLWTRWIRLSCY